MADVKFTGLPASSGIPDDGSLLAMSTYDGVSAYVSEKYTITQAKAIFGNAPTSTDNAIVRFDSTTGQVQNGTTTLSDAGVLTLPAEGKVVFNSTGTNKIFAQDSSNVGNKIVFDSSSNYMAINVDASSYFEIQGGGVTDYSKSWVYQDASQVSLGFTNNHQFVVNNTQITMSFGGAELIEGNATGLGFFTTTPVAQPTGVAVTASAIHAALVSLGLITA